MKYGFIGFGNLAKAIYQGLSTSSQNQFAFTSKSNITDIPNIKNFKSIPELVESSDIVFICVKPQDLELVLPQISNFKNKIFVSVVAGKKIAFFEKRLSSKANIVRIMPNLAIRYKKSVTAVCANFSSPKLTKFIQNLETLGSVHQIPEKDFDLFTVVYGSGPAVILTLLEFYESQAKKLNLPLSNIVELFEGAISFKSNNSDIDTKKLISKITSKKGVTHAILDTLKSNDFVNILKQSTAAGIKKSKSL